MLWKKCHAMSLTMQSRHNKRRK
uniref:Uncharacterized protein n=1 Tax=Rhizophora mucronata TaxID=61149 RepID=A0A2P2NXX4_RHIMU